MVKVEIVESLHEEIERTFNNGASEIFDLMETLETGPKKGRLLRTVGSVVIKELRDEGFRFYFITDGYKLKCLDKKELTDLLLKFVRMSDKKKQQKTINQIKHVLITLGPSGF